MNKKGDLLALRSLAVFLLSTFAALLVFSLLFSVIQLTPPNVDIAKSNIESFSSFVEYSFENNPSNEKCYSIMKITNMMNYQNEEEGSYIYFLDKNGFGRSKLDFLPRFLEDLENYDFLIEDYEEFPTEMKLYIDRTEGGSEILNTLSFGFGGNADKELNIEENDIKHILFVPLFTNQNSFEIIVVSEKGIIGGRNGRFKETDTEKLEGRHLVYVSDGGDKGLFITEDANSDYLVQSNLCSSKEGA